MDEEKRGGGDHVYFSFKRSGSCFSVPIRIYFGSALGFDSLRWTDLNSCLMNPSGAQVEASKKTIFHVLGT